MAPALLQLCTQAAALTEVGTLPSPEKAGRVESSSQMSDSLERELFMNTNLQASLPDPDSLDLGWVPEIGIFITVLSDLGAHLEEY